MDRSELYEQMATRKSKPKDFLPYNGDNGRVNRCITLMKSGQLRAGGKLLDIGGGIGDLGYAARDMFSWRGVVDISETNLQAAKTKGNETFHGDIDKLGLPGGEDIDLITALDFIEHIIDPENFARECFRVLKSGGEVFVNTPNIRFWRHIEQLWKTGKFPHTSGDREVYHGGHLAFFTYSDLCDIFGSAGFIGFKQFMDDECFQPPPGEWFVPLGPKNQTEFVQYSMELGCPNLLFKAVKP